MARPATPSNNWTDIFFISERWLRGRWTGVFWMVFTGIVLFSLFKWVSLKPEVSRNFFFSSDDPQFREDRQIAELFPEPQQIIIAAKGPVHSRDYEQKVRKLSRDLSAFEGVLGVQSITKGPEDAEDAFQSPLWKRVLIANDESATNIAVFLEDASLEQTVSRVEQVVVEHTGPEFSLMISGPPYIIEKIRKNLMSDLKIFSIAALVVFGVLILIFFKSFYFLLGTIMACINASALTLIVSNFFHIKMGILTANLSTIVFVLTLSHIVFISFNWMHLKRATPLGRDLSSMELREKAVQMTVKASFWSMCTTFIGFASLIFVQATPLQKLGISGSLGTLLAFLSAYFVFPVFLRSSVQEQKQTWLGRVRGRAADFFASRHVVLALALLLVGFGLSSFLLRLKTDPSLLSYFERGSELRHGLEYIDKNGGSSPLKIVLRDEDGQKFNSEEVYERFWQLQRSLEQYQPVGNVISLPLVLAEGKQRIPLSFLLSWDWLIDLLEQPFFGSIAKYFVTENRNQALIVLRMKESDRIYPRNVIIDQIKGIVWSKGFDPVLIGGVYLLQGRLAELVTNSLLLGLVFLIALFVIMGFFLTFRLQVAAGMFFSLVFIPLAVLGVFGLFNIPLDVIATPAANIAIAMGVDAMIHLMVYIKRNEGSFIEWSSWQDSIRHLWEPILTASLIICAGFGIFALSNFPPTKRFGFAVILGTAASPLAALVMLPLLSTFRWGTKFKSLSKLAIKKSSNKRRVCNERK